VWVKSIEEQFPNFVRDIADSKRSGMSFPEAIKIASKANYGKLTPEVQKMNNRLSWGTDFLRVMDIFNNSVKESKIISEAINIIKESYQSGGNVAATLDSIARDIVMIKNAEAERESMVKQHVMVMYGVFFMFLAIAVMIIQVMVPMIKATSQPEVSGGGVMALVFMDPCEGIRHFPCDIFYVAGLLLGIQSGVALYYVALFFIIVIIQGIFTGLIAGQLGENSIIAGSKHSLIMVSISLGIFMFLARIGMLPK
jgi:flagellar protein FlaJ